MSEQDYALSEHDRRIANIARVGTVTELDEANARVKVDLGDMTTEWLPWSAKNAGQDRTWHAPEPGEQVMVISPSGETSQGFVVGSFYQDASPANGNKKTVSRTDYQDGAFKQYDRDGHKYVLDVPSAGEIRLHIGSSVLILTEGAAVLQNGGSTLTITSGGTTLETPQLTVDAPQSTFTGNVLIEGGLTYMNGMTGFGGTAGAGASIHGPVDVQGDVTTAGALQNNGKNVGSTHSHSGVQSGTGSTGTPN